MSEYPSEETLERIRAWDIVANGQQALWDVVRDAWSYPDRIWEDPERPGHWHASTGGWSGNEDIIGALQSNVMFWLVCWEQSSRGGHYIFDLNRGTGR